MNWQVVMVFGAVVLAAAFLALRAVRRLRAERGRARNITKTPMSTRRTMRAPTDLARERPLALATCRSFGTRWSAGIRTTSRS